MTRRLDASNVDAILRLGDLDREYAKPPRTSYCGRLNSRIALNVLNFDQFNHVRKRMASLRQSKRWKLVPNIVATAKTKFLFIRAVYT